jgi:acyl homoserine lactone synthase
MQHFVTSQKLNDMSLAEQAGMFELRHEVFAVRLGWDVQTHNGQERDAFDDLAEASYIIAKSEDNAVDACWRLLPTTGPYMLRDTFPDLLGADPAPQDRTVWELSRFAVATNRVATSAAAFGPITKNLLAESARYALANGIKTYLTVTTLPIERLMRHSGLSMSRIGETVQVGVVKAVAVQINVDDKTLDAVGVCRPKLNLDSNHLT